MALVGQRRREWQTVYLHVFAKGLGLIEIVDQLLKFGITLQDLHELAMDECLAFGDAYDDEATDAAKVRTQTCVRRKPVFSRLRRRLHASRAAVSPASFLARAKDDASATYVSLVAAAKAAGDPSPPPPPGSTLDEDLAIDTGCSIGDARRLRRAVVKFFKGEKSLGFLRGHAHSEGAAANYYQVNLLHARQIYPTLPNVGLFWERTGASSLYLSLYLL